MGYLPLVWQIYANSNQILVIIIQWTLHAMSHVVAASLKEAAGWQTYALEYQYYRTSYISVWVCNVPTYMQIHNSEKQFIWKCPGIIDFGYWNMGTY